MDSNLKPRTVSKEKLEMAVRCFHKAGEAGLTREQLKKAVGISLRGVDGILENLRKENAIILPRTSKGQRKFVYWMKTPPKWDRRISGDTRLALRLAGLALSASGTRQWDGILDVLAKLAEEKMTEADRMVFKRMEHAVRIQGEVEDPIEGEKVLEPLLRAMDSENRRLVTLDYHAAGFKETKPCQVVPYALVHDLFAGSAFLVSWDTERNLAINLRLNRIESISINGRSHLGPEALGILEQTATYQVGGWSDSKRPPFDVVVRIKGKYWVQALQDAPPPLPDYWFEIEGSALKIHLKATHAAGVLRWVLQFGADAEVVSPDWLRKDLVKTLTKLTALYSA